MTKWTHFLAIMGILLAPSSALGWEQTMTCDENYPCAEGQEPMPTYWETPCIGFHLNENGSKYLSFDEAMPIAVDSIEAWNRPAISSLELQYLGATDEERIGYNPYNADRNANIIVFRDVGWSESRSIMALTTVTHQSSTGRIYDADIELNTTNWKFGVVESDGRQVVDFQNTLTHEIGHAFGLEHSNVFGATMFPYSSTGETNLRTLEDDDLEAIATIYPPDSTVECTFQSGYFMRPAYDMDENPMPDDCSASPISSHPLSVGWGIWGLLAVGILGRRIRGR